MERVLIQSDPMCMCLGVGGSGRKYWEIISILFCGGPEQSTPGRKTLEKKKNLREGHWKSSQSCGPHRLDGREGIIFPFYRQGN